mgnify:CR=1 FL=1
MLSSWDPLGWVCWSMFQAEGLRRCCVSKILRRDRIDMSGLNLFRLLLIDNKTKREINSHE